MKFIKWGLYISSLYILFACSSAPYMSKPEVDKLLAQNKFTFVAQRALPSNYDVIKIINNMPLGGSRVTMLDYNYSLKFSQDSLSVDLPYLGRAYTSSSSISSRGLKLNTSDFKYTVSSSKKGYLYKISIPNNPIQLIFIEIFNNGRAYISVDSNDRQPISFEGYLRP